MSPWQPNEATKHTHKATSSGAKSQWSAVANSVLNRTGDDASAIRQANAVIRNRFGKSSEGEVKPSPKRLGPTKGVGGRSRNDSSPTEKEEPKRKKAPRKRDTKRMFLTKLRSR